MELWMGKVFGANHFHRCKRWSNVSLRRQCLLDNPLASELCSCLQMLFYLLCFVRLVFLCIWDWDWRAQLAMSHKNMTLELYSVYPFGKSYLDMCQSNWILFGVLADNMHKWHSTNWSEKSLNSTNVCKICLVSAKMANETHCIYPTAP